MLTIEIRKELNFNDLKNNCCDDALDTLKAIEKNNKCNDFMEWLQGYFYNQQPTMTQLNNLLSTSKGYILNTLDEYWN